MTPGDKDLRGGLHWMAWFALQGEEGPEWLERYLAAAFDDLGEIIGTQRASLDEKTRSDLANLNLVLLAMSASLRGEAPMKLVLQRAKAGKPIDETARARTGHAAARLVEVRKSEGVKTEAAVTEAGAEFGISRAEVFRWMKHRRDFRDWAESQQKGE
jgi:hypothetical protein